jgi:hypothetical protein
LSRLKPGLQPVSPGDCLLGEFIKIVALCVVAAVGYGIVHDQVTARVCLEYFTIGHPPIFNTDSPTLLALGWGALATWWVGVLLGLVAAFASRFGPWPQVSARHLIRPICGLMVLMALASLAAGFVGYLIAEGDGQPPLNPLIYRLPASRYSAFTADAWAHSTSYGVGLLGGLGLCVWVPRRRLDVASTGD